MKTKALAILCFLASSLSLLLNETQIGVYSGFDDEGYNFTVTYEDGIEEIITFQKIEEEVLKETNLKSNEFDGITFEITYREEIISEEDEEGNEIEYEIYVITALKKVE